MNEEQTQNQQKQCFHSAGEYFSGWMNYLSKEDIDDLNEAILAYSDAE